MLRNFGYRFLISFLSETVWLPMILDCWSFVRCVFVSRPFSTNKVTNKNRLFRNPKGTPYSRHCLFKLRKRADRQQESWRAQLEFKLSNAKNGQELTEKLRFHVARFISGRTYATIAVKLLKRQFAAFDSLVVCEFLGRQKIKWLILTSVGVGD